VAVTEPGDSARVVEPWSSDLCHASGEPAMEFGHGYYGWRRIRLARRTPPIGVSSSPSTREAKSKFPGANPTAGARLLCRWLGGR
jgi:hypothetical protein